MTIPALTDEMSGSLHSFSEGDIDKDTCKDVIKLEISPQKSILKAVTDTSPLESSRHSVSWLDFHGKELHQVVEFEPSEHDEKEYIQPPPKKESACCVIS